MRRATRFITLLAAIGAIATPARAWEVDVHYILTFWLAEQAGFSREDAFAIAKANQAVDDSAYSSAVGSMIWILLRADEGAAMNVKRSHFPSDAPIPSPPQARAVKRNSVPARREVENCFNNDTAGDAMTLLGTALHPFQDSWSHEGIPDVPLRPFAELQRELSSAHPKTRGGWHRHDADLTYLHVDETVEMARETFLLLDRYLEKNTARRRAPARPWAEMEPIVRDFAERETRDAKDAWAAEHVPPNEARAKLGTLTLPGIGSGPRFVRYLRPMLPTGQPANAELERRATMFMKAWLIEGRPGAAAEFVDLKSIAASLGSRAEVSGGKGGLDVGRWVRKQLGSYLALDHSAINRAGHGAPDAPGYEGIPDGATGSTQLIKIPQAPLPTARDLVGVPDPGGRGPAWILAVYREDLPHDVLALRWQQLNSLWVITQILPIVN
jgi:hypothetical protein